MKLVLIIVTLCLCINPLFAQHSKKEKEIRQLIETQSYIALNQLTSKEKEKLSPVSLLMIEAIVGSKFNRYQESCTAIETLLNAHSAQLKEEEISFLYSLLMANLSYMGEFTQAYDMFKRLAPDDGATLSYYQMRKDAPPFEVIPPKKEVAIPFSNQEMGKGTHIVIEGTVNGTTDSFIFDTGCNEFNFVSEEFAEKHHLTVIFDSISTVGSTGAENFCKIAVAEEMTFGDFILKNPLFLVYDELGLPDSITLLPVLGTTVIEAFGEVQFLRDEQLMVIPQQRTAIPSCGQNLFLDDSYFLSLEVKGEKAIMLFDTGNAKTDLNALFYNANSKWVNGVGTIDSVKVGGFGKVEHYKVFTLPKMELSVCGNRTTLTKTAVMRESYRSKPYVMGSLGADFFTAYQKVIINFTDMFVIAE